MSLTISVDTEACVGAGQCALVAGGVFDQDDDGIVVLIEPVVQAPDADPVRRAAALCPARAIAVREG